MKMGLTHTKKMFLVVVFVTICTIIPSIGAEETNTTSPVGVPTADDQVWLKRAEDAWVNNLKAFHPDPIAVTQHLNVHTNRALTEFMNESRSNSTRRNLRGNQYKGPCMATNPIDRCWRCKPNWAENRKRLADCALGFARGTTGGKAGDIYVVTDSSDNIMDPQAGTLRHALIQPQPLWIIFSRSMTIRLVQELIMESDKTIDGRGVQVHIANGAGLTVQFVKNVIIHGIHIHDIVVGSGGTIRDSVDHFGFRTQSDGDGISIFGSSKVWIDHVSMWRCFDGLIDAIMGSTAITISNGHFTDHNEVMLFGASDSHTHDTIMQITVAYNHFGKRLIQRMPRCRFGYFHVVNNDYTHWEKYAIGGSKHPTIISQGNRFVAPPNIHIKEVTHRDYATKEQWMTWDWSSEGDLMENGAFFTTAGDPNFSSKHNALYDNISPAPGEQVKVITQFAGALNCKAGVPC